MHAPARAATISAGWTRPSESASTQNVPAEIAPTPAARPSMPSTKLRTFMSPTIQTIVSGYCTKPVENGIQEGQRHVVDADAGRHRHDRDADLRRELGHDRQVVDVVGEPHERAQTGPREDRAHRVPEPIRQQDDRQHRACEQGEAASQRDDAVVHPSPTRPVDSTEACRNARRRTVQEEREGEPERERSEGESRAVIHVRPS